MYKNIKKLKKITILLLEIFMIFFYAKGTEVDMKELEDVEEESLEQKNSLENIVFGGLERGSVISEIKEIKKINFNKNSFIILTFDKGRKIIIKNEKRIEIDGKKYLIIVRENNIVEIKDDENRIFFLKVE